MRLRAYWISALALAGLTGALAAQQASPPAWSLGAGAILYRISESNGWAAGPAVTAQRRLHRALRLDLNGAALLSSDGFYDFSGAALDVGPSLNLSSLRADLGIGGGLSGVVGGDSDGTGGGWVGGYLSAQGTFWMSPRVGLSVRGSYRRMTTERSSPSALAAVMFRL